MPDRLLLDQAIEAVADGKPVDWDLLDSQTSDAGLRDELACLRIIGALGNLHGSSPGEESEPSAHGEDEASSAARRAPGELGLWGRFRLLAQVGQGSFGRVYRAWDPQLEREVALKVLHGGSMSDRLKERVLREGRALARIHDTNVVAVHGVEWHEGHVALCMEFVRGRTLDDLLFSDGQVDVGEVVRIGRGVCRALSAVHRSGFVHRDVKARNVMCDEAGRIVLMDFGAGQEGRISDAARTSDMAGTPLYMAPELFDGGEASPCSDVYSVSVLLFYLLTGRYPRQGQTLGELRAAHHLPVRSIRQQRQDVPPVLARIIERGLAANPAERYPHAAALLEALDRQQEQRQEHAGVRRGWRRALLIAAAITGLALGLGSLTSLAFNHTLGRTGFTGETWGDWLLWGVRASVAPAFVFTVAWLLSACLSLIRRLLLAISDRAGRLDAGLRRRGGAWAARYRLDDPSVLAAGVVLASAAAMIAIWWSFWPLIDAVSTGIAVGRPETLALLSPAFEPYQDRYRQAFSLLLLASVMGWLAVCRLAARYRQVLRPDLVAGAAVVGTLIVVSLDLPYRLLLHNRFPVAQWRDQTCYVLGERTGETLLLCPNLPYRRVVLTSVSGLHRLEREENVYSAFAAARAIP